MPRDTNLIPEPLFDLALFDAKVFAVSRGESMTEFYDARRRGDVPRSADEHNRVSHLELGHKADQPPRPIHPRPGSGRGRDVADAARGYGADTRDAHGVKSAKLAQDKRGQGLHVVVPLAPKLDYDAVKAFSQAVVRHMVKVIRSRFVGVTGGGNRVGKIFIDYLRNGHGQTTACAFFVRSRPGLGVSMPVSWEQLPELKGGSQWTIATAPAYLSMQNEDPWKTYWRSRQTLTKAAWTLAGDR